MSTRRSIRETTSSIFHSIPRSPSSSRQTAHLATLFTGSSLSQCSQASSSWRRGFHTTCSRLDVTPIRMEERAHSTLSRKEGSRPIKRILLVKKPQDERTRGASMQVIEHILSRSTPPHLLLEQPALDDLSAHFPFKISSWHSSGSISVYQPHPPSPSSASTTSSEHQTKASGSAIDLIITIGGDGTVLHVSSLFDRGKGEEVVVPKVLAFSLGNLGFLLPFHIDSHKSVLDALLDENNNQNNNTSSTNPKFPILNRMRLSCEVFDKNGRELDCSSSKRAGGWQVMNEVAIHRGRYPHLSIVDAFVNGQHLTEAVADGLILATPTGSTAYSLSAGGPIAHPSINSFLLTPIAPRSLSFRTVLLPSEAEVVLQISQQSRAPSELSMDGREVCILQPGDYVKIKQSEYPIPCLGREAKSDDWVADINQLLQFNAGFRNKSLWQRHTTS